MQIRRGSDRLAAERLVADFVAFDAADIGERAAIDAESELVARPPAKPLAPMSSARTAPQASGNGNPAQQIALLDGPAIAAPPLDWPDDTTPDAPHPVYVSPAAMARAFAETDPPRRLASGLPALDAATRGGFPCGSRIVVAGPPGAGKSMLAAQWTHTWARDLGARVVYLAADQNPADLLIRIGERNGLERDDLDGAQGVEVYRAAWRDLAGRLDDLAGLVVLDGAAHCVETAVKALRTCAGDGPIVLVVDSLQTARCVAAADAANRRDAIDATLGELRRAQGFGALVVAISEMARGAYRSGDPSARTDALAASKESGAIEYAADVLIALRSARGEPDIIEAEIAKNRLGPRVDLRFRLDRRAATLTETDASAADAADARQEAARERRITEAEPRVIDAVLMASHSPTSKDAIAGLVRGRKADVLAAVSRLQSAGRLYRGEDGYHVAATGAL